MPTPTAAIRTKINTFLKEIETLTRQAALDAVRAALNGGVSTSAPARAGRRRTAPARAAAPKPRPGKRAKRTTEDVAATGDKLLAFVRSNPGCSVEQIREGLRMSKKEVALPLLRLREEKRLKVTGQKRGTRYFAGGKAAAPAKAASKKKRKPLSPENKKALLERLANARAARAEKIARKS